MLLDQSILRYATEQLQTTSDQLGLGTLLGRFQKTKEILSANQFRTQRVPPAGSGHGYPCVLVPPREKQRVIQFSEPTLQAIQESDHLPRVSRDRGWSLQGFDPTEGSVVLEVASLAAQIVRTFEGSFGLVASDRSGVPHFTWG